MPRNGVLARGCSAARSPCARPSDLGQVRVARSSTTGYSLDHAGRGGDESSVHSCVSGHAYLYIDRTGPLSCENAALGEVIMTDRDPESTASTRPCRPTPNLVIRRIVRRFRRPTRPRPAFSGDDGTPGPRDGRSSAASAWCTGSRCSGRSGTSLTTTRGPRLPRHRARRDLPGDGGRSRAGQGGAGGDVVQVNGRRPPYVALAKRDAARISEQMSVAAAAGFRLCRSSRFSAQARSSITGSRPTGVS
jgi:hypothetical protein